MMSGTRMNAVRTSHWRAAAALICAFALLVLSAGAPLHGHADPSQHACTLCQFEHNPADVETSSPLLTPPSPVTALTAEAVLSPDSPVFTAASGRAPPSIA